MHPPRPRLRAATWLALALLTIPACQEEDDDSVVPPDKPTALEHYLLEEGESNHLLPLYVDVDVQSRRAWCLSRLLGTVAQVDLDAAELIRVLPRYESTSSALRLKGDGPDVVWQLRAGPPALLRIEADSGHMRAVDVGLAGATDLLRLDEDRLLVTGELETGGYALLVLDGLLEVAQTEGVEVAPLQMEMGQDDTFGVLMQGGRIDVRDVDTLQLLNTCTSPFMGHTVGNTLASLPDGDFVVTQDTTVGRASCDGGEPIEIEEGTENWDVLVDGDEVLVLDRIGGDEPNWGEMRRYDVDLDRVGDPLPTGKNSGYGGLDGVLAWMNSEGSSDLWAVHADTGELAHRVQTGLHVESLAVDPAHPGRVYASGRLSDLLIWVDMDTGEALHAELDFHWPVVPTVADGKLWVLDQLDADLHALDLDTLDELATYDLGLSTNTSLTLSDMALHPDRGTLFVTHGWDNELVEVDPADGTVVGRWELGGEVLDKDESGRLEVLIGPNEVLTVRSVDGRITRIDPDAAALVDTAAPVSELIPKQTRLQYAALSEDGTLLFVGPYAIDAATLEHLDAQDRGWTFAALQIDGSWIAWRGDDVSILTVDSSGAVTSVLPTEIVAGAQAPEFHYAAEWEQRLLFTDLRRAGILAWPMKVD
jgi:hypothetical protein